ncbi:hypothetical protein [Endozoicomonas acroporae]|uniref:hypothetical protein n=1 Tax=Endozoicomonas acroporae TaxID=1701104 RepID=UPI0013D0EFE2|nr:hypothetical protein [Endozoicomonas acroporae]
MKEHYLVDFNIDLDLARKDYDRRKNVSDALNNFFNRSKAKEYAELAVGYTDNYGNFSASQHGLSEYILSNNKPQAIFNFAKNVSQDGVSTSDLPALIWEAGMPYVKISVGSEIACLLRPDHFWIGNVRTIWSHLVIKHKGDWERANEEYVLYRFDDIDSEMNYKIWREIYTCMGPSLDTIHDISLHWAKEQNVEPGEDKYLWTDVVCSYLYES